jgi:hypothetical protein
MNHRKKLLWGIRFALSALAIILTTACASSKISSLPVSGQRQQVINVIAFAPGGGMLSEAVGVELSNMGFTIIDAASTSDMLVRMNLNEVQITRPESLSKFRNQGVDAILVVRAAGGYDYQPQSASARMSSTQNGQILVGVTWQNGYGGMSGSPADRMMRKGLTDAAAEIAASLASRIRTAPQESSVAQQFSPGAITTANEVSATDAETARVVQVLLDSSFPLVGQPVRLKQTSSNLTFYEARGSGGRVTQVACEAGACRLRTIHD